MNWALNLRLITWPILLNGLLFCLNAQPSSIDAHFRLKRIKQKSGTVHGSRSHKNEFFLLYKELFSKSMYSECRWMPSDSEYSMWMSQKCGHVKGVVFSVSRFMKESDAYRHSAKTLVDHNHLRFEDFNESCQIF